MPLIDIANFLNQENSSNPEAGRLLGLDVGKKTVGLAVCDPDRKVATPITTLYRSRFTKDVADLQRINTEWQITGLVIGLPINMDGSEGPRCQSVRQFVRNLEAYINLPCCFWDERLSTKAVTRAMIKADLSRRRRRQLVDKLAAGYILQGMLDALQMKARRLNQTSSSSQ